MNTQDYKDVKLEIFLKYEIRGLYVMQLPVDEEDESTFNVVDPEVYGFGELIDIKVLDSAVMSVKSLLTLASFALLLVYV